MNLADLSDDAVIELAREWWRCLDPGAQRDA